MHSSYSLDYILKLPIRNITRLLVGAWDKKEENKAWDLYLIAYSNMTKETYIAFEDYYRTKKATEVEITTKSESEILIEVKEILNTFNGGENY